MDIRYAERQLGLPFKYTSVDVKRKWRSKLKKYHPDLGHSPKRAVLLNIAKYIVLDSLSNEDEEFWDESLIAYEISLDKYFYYCLKNK
jgi:hypothetical protein